VEATDALLTARLAAGDDRALAEAFDQLGPAVYGAALRVLGEWNAAQDVAQDVFVELWSHPAGTTRRRVAAHLPDGAGPAPGD
jgi:RNA polymerase sigma-70 factor (ECF subfamily)